MYFKGFGEKRINGNAEDVFWSFLKPPSRGGSRHKSHATSDLMDFLRNQRISAIGGNRLKRQSFIREHYTRETIHTW